MPRGPVFGFEHVTVRGDRDETMLRDLDVEIRVDGVTAILGPSGAGKTTLLRLCNRLEVPTEGRVTLDGVDLASLDPLGLRRRVGMVFQQPTVFAGTVRDNLDVADPDIGPGAAAALARVGLDPVLLDRQGDDLSGGEAQRLCLARTLLTEPDVILMDEPTSSLDRANRGVIEELGVALARAGIAIVWVTHDLAQAERIATKTVVLLDGRVATDAEAAEFMDGSPRPPDARESRERGSPDARD